MVSLDTALTGCILSQTCGQKLSCLNNHSEGESCCFVKPHTSNIFDHCYSVDFSKHATCKFHLKNQYLLKKLYLWSWKKKFSSNFWHLDSKKPNLLFFGSFKHRFGTDLLPYDFCPLSHLLLGFQKPWLDFQKSVENFSCWWFNTVRFAVSSCVIL